MGARDLSHALSLALLLVGPWLATSSAQGAGLPPNLQRLQDASVAAERRDQFFVRWEEAPGALRAAAAAALDDLQPAGRRLDGWPSTKELALAIRVLEGGVLEDLLEDPRVAFVDAIGLLIVPGVAAVEPERGEPLTVRVHQTSRVERSDAVEVSLLWQAQDGSLERVRREPFPGEAFLSSFPMYIRAPRTAGRWQLIPEVHFGGESLRGFGVPLATRLEPDTGMSPEAHELLTRYGVRSPEVARASTAGGTTTGTRGTLFVGTGKSEDPQSFQYGLVGARWRQLASEFELRLVVGPARELTTLLPSAAGPTFLVARGDGVAETHLALLGQQVELAGIVLSTSMEEPGPALPAVPTLLIGAEVRTPAEAGHVRYLRGGPTPFLTEPELPSLVAPWLRERLAR